MLHLWPSCLLFFAQEPASEPTLEKRHEELFEKVTSSMKNGDLGEAHLRSVELRAEFPRSISALSVSSAVASRRGQHGEAHALMDATLRVLPQDDPQEPQTVLQLATELVSLGRTSTARLVLQQLLSRDAQLSGGVAKSAADQLARVNKINEQQDTMAVAFSATAAPLPDASLASPPKRSEAYVNMPRRSSFSGAPSGRPRLVIFVHTCTAFERTRAAVLQRTWAKDRPEVIFITDVTPAAHPARLPPHTPSHAPSVPSREQNPESELEPHEYLGPYLTKGSADLSYHPVTLARMFELYLRKYASEADWLMLIDDVRAALDPTQPRSPSPSLRLRPSLRASEPRPESPEPLSCGPAPCPARSTGRVPLCGAAARLSRVLPALGAVRDRRLPQLVRGLPQRR